MRAVVFAGPGRAELVQRPDPVAGPGDVLVRVLACGLCGTDLRILADPPAHHAAPGVVLGHEIVAEAAGRRVAVRPDIACGACPACREGAANHCARMVALGITADGGLAELLAVPERALVPLPDDLPLPLAALTEPLACVLAAVRRAAPGAGETALVLGGGAIGLLFAAVLRASGLDVQVTEPAEPRRVAARRLGITAVPPGAVRSGAAVVVDAVGGLLGTAVDLAGRGGRIVAFGRDASSRPAVDADRIVAAELSVLGSFVGPHEFAAAARLLPRLGIGGLVDRRLGLADVPGVIPALRGGAVLKAVVELPMTQT